MARQARVGDTGVGYCPVHNQTVTVTFLTGSENSTSNGIAGCCVGAIGIASCGHRTVALTGSSLSQQGGLAPHRVGDTGLIDGGGTYVVVSGSPDVDIG